MAASAKPRFIVQCDWSHALRQNNGKAWVTFRKAGQPTVHSEIKSHGISATGDPYISTTDGFKVEQVSKRWSFQKKLTLSYEDGGSVYSNTFLAHHSEIRVHQERKSVTCLDVTSGGLAVSCDSDAKLRVWTTADGDVRRHLEGHLGDVYTCRFFPSGLVVLSGGADMQLKIWSAETGSCAATLQGHRGGITDTAIVDRGRNVVSSSRDGSVKLWDCGQSSCIGTFTQIEGGIINGISVGAPVNTEGLGTRKQPSSDREVSTEGKMLLVACESGQLQGYGLHSRQKLFETACGSAVNCCTFVTPVMVAAGTQDGHLLGFDIRNTSVPLSTSHLKESRGPILSLLPHKQGCFATTGDGSCCYIDEENLIRYEFSGPDCDPLYRVVYDGTYFYTACRDSIIRKYRLL